MTTPPPVVPSWLLAASDMVAVSVAMGASPFSWLHAELPVCDVDCLDGALYYEVLGAWGVPWARAPRPQFLKAWYTLSPKTRESLMDRYSLYFDVSEVLHQHRVISGIRCGGGGGGAKLCKRK